MIQNTSKNIDWRHETQIILVKERMALLEAEDLDQKKALLQESFNDESLSLMDFVGEIYRFHLAIIFVIIIIVALILGYLLAKYKFLVSLSFCLEAAYEQKKIMLEEQDDILADATQLADYQSRIEHLSELLAEQQEKVSAAVDLEERLAKQSQLLKEHEEELEDVIQQRDDQAAKHQEEIASLNAKSEYTLRFALDKAGLEQERAVLKVKEEANSEIADLNRQYQAREREHSDEVRSLYAQIDKLREQLSSANKGNENE